MQISRTLLQRFVACLNFRFRFILLVQTEKVISMNYGSSTSSWKPWRWLRLDLIFTRDLYINSYPNPLKKFTSSSRTEFKDILQMNISQMITKTIPISMRTVISYAMKRDIPLRVWRKANENWDIHVIKNSQQKESHCRVDTSIRRNK